MMQYDPVQDRMIAINQFKSVLEKLSHRGLKTFFTDSMKLSVSGFMLDTMTRQDLIDRILVAEYGKQDMETYNAK